MKVHKFNIVNPKPYTVKSTNEEKTFYAPVGTMTVFIKDDGSQSRIMSMHADNVEYLLFKQEPREQKPTANVAQAQAPAPVQAQPVQQSYPTGDINPEDIPF